MRARWCLAAAVMFLLTGCADAGQTTPFEPAFHLAKQPCRGDDTWEEWETGVAPDRNANGKVCARFGDKGGYYDDHYHLDKK